MEVEIAHPRVLFAHPMHFCYEEFRASLGDEVEIIHAQSRNDALVQFATYPCIKIIIVDSFLSEGQDVGERLVVRPRAGFIGPIIAISSESLLRTKLI